MEFLVSNINGYLAFYGIRLGLILYDFRFVILLLIQNLYERKIQPGLLLLGIYLCIGITSL